MMASTFTASMTARMICGPSVSPYFFLKLAVLK